jgi:hypothetical protein
VHNKKSLIISTVVLAVTLGAYFTKKSFSPGAPKDYLLIQTFEKGCQLFTMAGDLVRIIPGSYCNLFANGDTIFAMWNKPNAGEVIKSHGQEIIWRFPAEASHEIFVSPQDGSIWFIDMRKVNSTYIDTLIAVSADGKEIFRWGWEDYFKILDSYSRSIRHHPLDKLDDPVSEDDRHFTLFNSIQVLPDNKIWQKLPAFRPGNIMISDGAGGYVFVIDRNTKDIVWLYHSVRGSIHTATLQPNGHIAMFVNRWWNPAHRDVSYLVELDPISNTSARAYTAWPELKMACDHYGSVQRLDNGNFVIAYGCDGSAAFEVDASGKRVWELSAKVFNNEGTQIYRAKKLPQKLVENWLTQLGP